MHLRKHKMSSNLHSKCKDLDIYRFEEMLAIAVFVEAQKYTEHLHDWRVVHGD